MEQAITIALSRQMTLRRAMDMVANNVANANTPAYKAESPVFTEFLMKDASAEDHDGRGRLGGLSYVIDSGTHRDMADGNIITTGNPLDFAINGEGYFSVLTDGGERYTRAGHFSINEAGQLITSEGDPVLSDGGAPIQINPDDGAIEVGRDGTIATANGTIGRLGIVEFEDERAMKKVGSTYYETEENPAPVANPVVMQGAIENSNVQPVVEMTRMIEVMRTYQSTQRSIEKMGEMSQAAIRQLGREPR